MNFSQVIAWMELPLLKRELIEASHRKRNYALRVLVALIFMLVMLVFYSERIARFPNVLQVMGRGRELAAILLVCNLVAIYLLLPAMACSAISSERERQTLSLILITRITPGGLIAEKFMSRLVPMFALMLITLPMLSIAYLLGGLRLEAVFAALIGLFTAAVQVNSTSIMCSALFRTALEAFWATYLLFAIMLLGPILLHELDLLPIIYWFPMVGRDTVAMPFVLFLGMSVGAIEGFASVGYVLLSTVPPLTVAITMLVISRFAIAHGQQDAPLSFRTFGIIGRRIRSIGYRLASFPYRMLVSLITGESLASTQPRQDTPRPIRPFPVNQPVAWRELQISALSGWRLHAAMLAALLLLEWVWLMDAGKHGRHACEEVCVIVDVCLFIICLLLVVGSTCRTFASERERQTLDLLLTTPLSNRELLHEKLAASNRTTLFLTAPLLLTAITHLLFGQMRVWDDSTSVMGNYYPNQEVYIFQPVWWSSSVRYMFGMATHALLYMSLARWIAVYFSLRFNSQMKAMLGTILSILGLCVIPAVVLLVPLLLLGSDPDRLDLPIWYLTSPAIIFGFNESNEFHNLFRSSWWPRSEYFTLIANLAIYGLLTLAVRTYVIKILPDLLNRRDSNKMDGNGG